MFRDNLSVPSSGVKKFKSSWTIGPILKSQVLYLSFLPLFVDPTRRYRTTTQRCVISQKSADLNWAVVYSSNITDILFCFSAIVHVITGFRRGVNDTFAVLGSYTALIGSWLQTFRTTYRSHLHGNSLSLKMGPIGCPETSVVNYQ
jgi:hypothetical protein